METRATRPILSSLALLVLVPLSPCRAETRARDSDDLLEWEELAALPDIHGFAGPIVGIACGALVVAGGTNFPDGRPWDGATKVWHDRIFVLRDPAGEWIELKERLPRPLAHAVSVTVPDGILVIGGGDASAHFREVFLLQVDSDKVSFQSYPSLPVPLALASGAVVGRTVYVAGGMGQPSALATSKSFFTLDLDQPPNRRAWRELESWPGPGRMLAAAAAREGAFYLFSGVDLSHSEAGIARRTYLTDAYRFDPRCGWRRVSDLPRPAAAAPAPSRALGSDQVLVIGGDTGEFAARVTELKDSHPGFSHEILAYHTHTDTWTTVGNLPRKLGSDPANRPNDGLWPPAVTAAVWWNGRLVIPTGEIRPGVRTPRVLTTTSVPRRVGP